MAPRLTVTLLKLKVPPPDKVVPVTGVVVLLNVTVAVPPLKTPNGEPDETIKLDPKIVIECAPLFTVVVPFTVREPNVVVPLPSKLWVELDTNFQGGPIDVVLSTLETKIAEARSYLVKDVDEFLEYWRK